MTLREATTMTRGLAILLGLGALLVAPAGWATDSVWPPGVPIPPAMYATLTWTLPTAGPQQWYRLERRDGTDGALPWIEKARVVHATPTTTDVGLFSAPGYVYCYRVSVMTGPWTAAIVVGAPTAVACNVPTAPGPGSPLTAQFVLNGVTPAPVGPSDLDLDDQ